MNYASSSGVNIVSPPPTHQNSHIQIKQQLIRVAVGSVSVGVFPARFSLDESVKVEANDIFKFNVGVKKEGGMIRVGEAEWNS
jgi:hypothetical protein